jgi:hypothetical protein
MAPAKPAAAGAFAEAGKTTGEALQGRIDQWQKKVGNHRTRTPKEGQGLPGAEESAMPVAELTELGPRLLGAKRWE